jgi:hypothetical protein
MNLASNTVRCGLLLVAVSAFLASVADRAGAAPILVPNGSFDADPQPVTPPGYTMVPGTQGAITDWAINVDGTGASNNGAGLYSNSYLASNGFTGGDGNNAAWIDAFSNGTLTTSTLTSSNIGAAQPNTIYKVTIATGNYENIAGDVGITLLEGGTPVASTTILPNNPTFSQSHFSDFSLVVPATDYIGGQLQVVLSQTYDGSFNGYPVGGGVFLQQVSFDNVRLDAEPVPEPGSIVLLQLGAIGLVVAGRRRILRALGF